ncbi:MAG: hypothetical protein LBJ90_07060 [Treponema sp.]|jgi:hypothetical protein|nr:hypothetical protein [Treponema sp.]
MAVIKKIFFIRGEGLIPCGSAAVIKILNPRPIPYENNIPRRTGGPSSAARLLIGIILLCLAGCFTQNDRKEYPEEAPLGTGQGEKFLAGADPVDSLDTEEAEIIVNQFTVMRYVETLNSYWTVSDLTEMIDRFNISKTVNELTIQSSTFSDASPLAEFHNLQKLLIINNDNLHDISPLASLAELEYLDMAGCYNIENIDAISSLRKLKKLCLFYYPVTDFSELRNCTGLEKLTLYGDKLVTTEVISGLTKLQVLELDFRRHGILDVSYLRNLTGLTELTLVGDGAIDLTWIKNLVKLERLTLNWFEINDVSPLAELPELIIVDFHRSIVANMPVLFKSDSLRVIVNPSNEYEYTEEFFRKGMSAIERYEGK